MHRLFMIFYLLLFGNYVWSQPKEDFKVVDTLVLKSDCPNSIVNGYVLKVKHFLICIPDSTYEQYSMDYADTTNAFHLTKGKISSLTSKSKKLLNNLLFEKGQYCCIYNLKNKTWLTTFQTVLKNCGSNAVRDLLRVTVYFEKSKVFTTIEILINRKY